jgi:biopolymer transport protein ExbD
MRPAVFLLACILIVGPWTPTHAGDAARPPLRIVVVDGQVVFGGANLDLDELRTALASSDHKDETLYFQVGPNAKSTYISQVLKVVKQAGFSKLAIVGPTGPETVLTIDPAARYD